MSICIWINELWFIIVAYEFSFELNELLVRYCSIVFYKLVDKENKFSNICFISIYTIYISLLSPKLLYYDCPYGARHVAFGDGAKAEPLVERHVPRVERIEAAGKLLAIEPREHRADQGGGVPVSLAGRIDAQQLQVPMWKRRVPLAQPADVLGEPPHAVAKSPAERQRPAQAARPQHRQQRRMRRPRRQPHRNAFPPRRREIRFAMQQSVTQHAAEEPRRKPRVSGGVGNQATEEGVGVEQLREHLGRRPHVRRRECRASNVVGHQTHRGSFAGLLLPRGVNLAFRLSPRRCPRLSLLRAIVVVLRAWLSPLFSFVPSSRSALQMQALGRKKRRYFWQLHLTFTPRGFTN